MTAVDGDAGGSWAPVPCCAACGGPLGCPADCDLAAEGHSVWEHGSEPDEGETPLPTCHGCGSFPVPSISELQQRIARRKRQGLPPFPPKGQELQYQHAIANLRRRIAELEVEREDASLLRARLGAAATLARELKDACTSFDHEGTTSYMLEAGGCIMEASEQLANVLLADDLTDVLQASPLPALEYAEGVLLQSALVEYDNFIGTWDSPESEVERARWLLASARAKVDQLVRTTKIHTLTCDLGEDCSC